MKQIDQVLWLNIFSLFPDQIHYPCSPLTLCKPWKILDCVHRFVSRIPWDQLYFRYTKKFADYYRFCLEANCSESGPHQMYTCTCLDHNIRTSQQPMAQILSKLYLYCMCFFYKLHICTVRIKFTYVY